MAGTPTPRTVTEVRLPLSAYEPTREQIQTLDDAGRILPTDCLRRFGITGSVPLPPSSRTVVGDMSDRRAALLDEDQAKRYGYRRFTDSSDTGAGASHMPVTPEGIQALRILRGKADPVNGVAIPEGGCIGEADRKLAQGAGRLKRVGSDVHSQLNFVLGLQADAEKMAEGDSRVQAVTRRWSACMRRSGYSYRAPGDAIMDKRWSDEEDSPVTPRGDQYRRRGRAMPA